MNQPRSIAGKFVVAAVLAPGLLPACGAAPEDDGTAETSQDARGDRGGGRGGGGTVAAGAGTTTRRAEALTFAQRTTICQTDPRVQAGVVSLDVCVGAEFFLRETFNGNGRTCATCHRVDRNFTIDPGFIARLPNNDALFVAEFNPALANLERPAQMRARSLILENVDGTQPGGPSVRFVLRTTPHNLSMGVSVTNPVGAVSPPEERTGWSGDGAPGRGRLADFTNGAIGQHFTRSLNRVAGTDFRVATEDEGQRVALYMRELGRKNDINLTAVGFSDAGADLGRQRFLAVGCNGCHNNAGANTGGVNRNFNSNVESARNAGLAGFPADGGFLASPTQPNGGFGDGTFNSTPLIEAADTGPFFHTDTTVAGAPSNNTPSANTIEQAIAFYASPAFGNRPGANGAALALSAGDITNIGRFLRSVNAVFNIQMASKRVEGARQIGNVFGNGTALQLTKQMEIIVLARVEVDDAIAVLQGAQGGALSPAQVTRLQNARTTLNAAATNTNLGSRQSQLGVAFNLLDLADTEIAANVNFVIGAGTLMN